MAKSQKDILVITCDVSTSAGLDRYRKTFTDQYIDLGIAEQNMIGSQLDLLGKILKL